MTTPYCSDCDSFHPLFTKCKPRLSCVGCLVPLPEYEIGNYDTIDYTEESAWYFQHFCKECYFALMRCQSQLTRAQIIVKPDEPDVINEFY